MRKYGLLATSALRSAFFVGASIAIAAPAFAQSTSPDPARTGATDVDDPANLEQNEVELESGREAEPGTGEEVVITGTRINRPNLVSSVPITSVGVQELTATGNVALGDQLNQLPQLRATFSQANSQRFIGTAGISALDLRGLGSARTLVLVNGRRQITATPGIQRVDVNTIPVDLISRVDIVTGGNSAIYGSDAVAGVVNFVLKRDFEGIRMRGQGGLSSRGDTGTYFVSLTAGQNFGDNRGNIAVSAEYARQNELRFTDRDAQTGAFRGRSQFNPVENTGPQLNPSAGPIRTGPEPSTGNGIPDTAFLRNVRNNSISEGGLLTAACPVAAATGESAAQFAARRAAACTGIPNPGSSNALSQFGRTFVFQPDGLLIANPCVTDLRGPSGGGSPNCIGGLGSTLRLTGFLQPGLERKAVNLLAHYEISPAFVPFIEARFVRVDAQQEGQPTFTNATLLPTTFSINNPFLGAQARAQLVSILAPGVTTFSTQRFNVDFGGRGEDHRRDSYQIIGGVSGTFNEDWKYEVALNYGRFDSFYETRGNILSSRFINSVNAVRNAQGQIVCGINADTNPNNDDPACVPVNLFGSGAVSQAALDYFGFTSTRRQEAELYNGVAYVSGDLSQLFELPGGPISFVLGGEYRRETAFSAFDPTTSQGLTFLNRLPNFNPPDLEVKDAFAEVSIPLLRDLPFAHNLTIDAAGRVSDYNLGSTGTVFAYNVNGTYAPVRDLRFRVGYARAIRAPTQSDLFNPQSQTFLNGLQDPCGQQNINNNPNRVRNCAALGVPTTQTFAGTTEPFTNRAASGISGLNAGNPELREEQGTSLTAGFVAQPSFLPGFSLTVDYYRVKVDNVIFGLGGQTLINQCVDNPSGINNPFCAVVFRNPNGTFVGQSNVIQGGTTVNFPTTGNGASFISQPFNFAKQITSGVDVDMAYRRTISEDVKLNLRGIVSRTFKRNNFTDIARPEFADRQLSELGDPKWQGQLSTNLEVGAVNFGYRFRYIGKQTIGEFETQNSFQGRPPLNPDAFPRVYYPDVTYHDFRLDITATERFKFYTGVDNAFDRLPPLGLLGTEAGNPFGPVGRFFYAGAEVKF